MNVEKIIQANQALQLLAKQRKLVMREITKRRAKLAAVSIIGSNDKVQILASEIQGYEAELGKVDGQIDERKQDLQKAMSAS